MSGSDVHHSCSHFQAGIWPQSQTNCKEVRKYSLAGCHGRRRKSNKHLNLRILKYRTPNVPPKKKLPFFSGVFPITLSDNSIIPVAQAKQHHPLSLTSHIQSIKKSVVTSELHRKSGHILPILSLLSQSKLLSSLN